VLQGGPKGAPQAPEAAREDSKGTTERSARPAPEDTVFIARQPIFDASERVTGYELLFRSSGLTPERTPASIGEAANLLMNVLSRFGVAQALGDRKGFLQLGADVLASDLIELVPQERFVLEYPSVLLATPELAARCAHLKTHGYSLARLVGAGETDLGNAAATSTLVVYDLALQPLQEILRLDRAAKAQKQQRLVRNVNTRADFENCKTFSFDLYQGRFFARPESLSMNRLDPGRVRVMEIFNLVINRADIGEIEDAFKHDVALCYSLLCYINSVGIGLQYKVSSIRDAVMLLGYDFLWRWLSLLIFAGVDLTAAQRVLLNTAVIRGRLMELLGQAKLSSKDGNFLFVVGAFSMLDALLGIPLEDIAGRLHLPREVSDALLSRSGRYAPYLELALAFETDNLLRAQQLCAELGIDLSSASRAHLAAIEWAGVLAK
jgi:EAL and modified HD-GYP domain-containing signal transduction protein